MEQYLHRYLTPQVPEHPKWDRDQHGRNAIPNEAVGQRTQFTPILIWSIQTRVVVDHVVSLYQMNHKI
jgi:hypothetical protein